MRSSVVFRARFWSARASSRRFYNDILRTDVVDSSEKRTFSLQPFLSVQLVRVAPEKKHDHKKYWNAAARDLSDSRRNHHALSRRYRSNRDGNCGAHSGHFDSDRQIVKRLQLAEREDESV
jgi:hypothetical protein